LRKDSICSKKTKLRFFT